MTLSRDEEVQAVQMHRKYCGSDVDVVATSVIATIINRSSVVVPALQRGTAATTHRIITVASGNHVTPRC